MHINRPLVFFFFLNFVINAQQEISVQYMSPKIEELVKIVQTQKLNQHINVYSIQLESSEQPEIITKTKNQYAALFTEELIDEVFEPPYFKVIIGAYLDQKIAEKKLKSIQKKFKSAFVLKREINIKRFIEYQ